MADLLLRRTLHCLLKPACSQVNGCSGCARVAVSMPGSRAAVARVWHASAPLPDALRGWPDR
jgi:hypothetical protein